MIFGNTIYSFYTIYKGLSGTFRLVPVPTLGWDGTRLSFNKMGRDHTFVGWDGISHRTNSCGMGLENFLRDEMRLNLRGMGRPVPVPRSA